MKYQWLKDYQELTEQLAYLKWNLSKSILELQRWVEGDLQGIKLESSSRAASLEEKIKFIETEIGHIKEQMTEARIIFDSFESVDSQIIKLKYIDDLTLEEISEELGYSHSYIRKRHADITKTLKFLENYQGKKQARLQKEAETEFYQEKVKLGSYQSWRK